MRLVRPYFIGEPDAPAASGSKLIIPAGTPLATAMREPNLLVPGRKPVGAVEIDWTHPLARDLMVAIVPVSGHLYDLVSGKKLILDGAVAPKFGGPEGCVVDCSDAGIDVANLSYSLAGANGCTTATRVKFNDASQDHTLFCYTDSSVRQYHAWADTNGASIRAALYTTSASYASVTFTIGEWTDWGCSANTSGSHILINGSNVGGGVAFNSAISTLDISLSGIFQQKNAGTKASDAEYSYFFAWRRYVDEETLKAFQRNPHQILKPANDAPYILSVPGASGPTIDSITMSNVQQTTATATVAVTIPT